MHEELDQLWRQRPFKPFRLRLANGESYVVRRPNNFMVLKSTFYLSLPDGERFIFRDIAQIAGIDSVQRKKARK